MLTRGNEAETTAWIGVAHTFVERKYYPSLKRLNPVFLVPNLQRAGRALLADVGMRALDKC